MRFAIRALAVAAVMGTTPALANIVQNPGFETGDLTDWTVNTGINHPWNIQTFGGAGGNPFDGSYYASTGCVGAACISTSGATLSQTLATTAGDTYALTFEFGTNGYGAPNELAVYWDGALVLDLGPGGTLGPIPNYTLETVPNLTASTGATVLTFAGRQDPVYDALDSVDVELTSVAVPEPASVALLGGALLGLGGLRRRRQKL